MNRHRFRRAHRALATSFALAVALAPAAASAATPAWSTSPPISRVDTAPTAPRARDSAPLRVGEVSPAVATPDTDVTLTVVVRNTGTAPATPRVTVSVGDPLRTRARIAEHAAHPRTDGDVTASTAGTAMAPGTEATVTVTIPADDLRLRRPFGVLPLTVGVTGMGQVRPVASFLPYQVIKEYEPLRVGIALPVTADPDPVTLTGTFVERAAAWTRMLGPGSRIDRVLKVADTADATLVVDPSLLAAPAPAGPSASPSATVAATGSPSPSAPATASPDPVTQARSSLTERIAALDADVWFLPPGDPDVSALAGASGDASLPPLRPAPTTLPGTRRSTPTVGWPAGASTEQVRRAIRDASRTAPAGVLVDETRADPDPERTGGASRRDDDGRPVLVVDDRMSDLLSIAADAASASDVTQRVLAESVALLAESPGRSRTVLLLPDRAVDPDPGALGRVLSALRSAPWVTPVSGAQLLATPPTDEAVVDDTSTPQGPGSPLTAETAAAALRLGQTADGLRPSLGDPGLVPEDLGENLVGTRWRAHGPAWRAAQTKVQDRLDHLTQGVHVVPSAINFFAEHGMLQVTVVNDLDVEVRDVRLTAKAQGRPPRLIVRGDPAPLTIRPHSRTTVRLDVEAIAAGVVPVTASLRTPGGTPLGEDATVSVRVQPTNGWVVLAAGGVVGVIFLFGLFRALRMGERRVAEDELRGLDLR